MKTANYTTKKNLIASLFVAIIILLSGCEKHKLLQPASGNVSQRPILTATETTPEPNDFTIFSSQKTVDLVIGSEQLVKIGTVTIKNHSGALMEVTYTLLAPWKMTTARLYIGNPAQIPTDSEGNALPDQFTYKQNLSLGGSGSYSFLLAKNLVSGCRTTAVQAMVYNSETLSIEEPAWGRGTKISTTADIGMYYSYCVSDYRPAQLLD